MAITETYIDKPITAKLKAEQVLDSPVMVQIPMSRAQYAYHLIRNQMDSRRPSIRYNYRGTTMSELQLNEKIGKSMIGLEFVGFVITDATIVNNKVRFKLELHTDPDDIELEITTGCNADIVQTFGGR